MWQNEGSLKRDSKKAKSSRVDAETGEMSGLSCKLEKIVANVGVGQFKRKKGGRTGQKWEL